MMLTYYLKRIFSNKLKLAVALLFFFFPIADLYLTLSDIRGGGSVLYPFLGTFLCGTIGKWGLQLLLWYLPLYLLLLVAEDCIEDVKIGYRNILITKWGKRKYITNNLVKGFVISFSVMFLSLAINLLMSLIIFNGGTYIGYDPGSAADSPSLMAAFVHPWLTNWIYILMTSFISGIVGMGAVAVSLLLPNRFLAYPIVFLMWYLPSTIRQSILIALQPFTEYSLGDVLPTILLVIGINIAVAIAAFIKVMKYDQV